MVKDFSSILRAMSEDKNVKNVVIEFKRMSGGIKMEYTARVGDATRMGVEFVNAKDFEADASTLLSAEQRMLQAVDEVCTSNITDKEVGILNG
jgi:hypothetical protein